MEHIDPIIQRLGAVQIADGHRYQREAEEHFERGLIAHEMRRLDLAIDLYEVAWTRSGHTLVPALNNGGCILFYWGSRQELRRAEVTFRHAVHYQPEDPVLWFNLAATQLRRNELLPALKALRGAVHYGHQDIIGMRAQRVILALERRMRQTGDRA